MGLAKVMSIPRGHGLKASVTHVLKGPTDLSRLQAEVMQARTKMDGVVNAGVADSLRGAHISEYALLSNKSARRQDMVYSAADHLEQALEYLSRIYKPGVSGERVEDAVEAIRAAAGSLHKGHSWGSPASHRLSPDELTKLGFVRQQVEDIHRWAMALPDPKVVAAAKAQVATHQTVTPNPGVNRRGSISEAAPKLNNPMANARAPRSAPGPRASSPEERFPALARRGLLPGSPGVQAPRGAGSTHEARLSALHENLDASRAAQEAGFLRLDP